MIEPVENRTERRLERALQESLARTLRPTRERRRLPRPRYERTRSKAVCELLVELEENDT